MRKSSSKSALLATLLVIASVVQLAHGYMGAAPGSYYGGMYPYDKIIGSNQYPESSYNTYTSLGIFSDNTETSALYSHVNTVCPSVPELLPGGFTLLCCNQRPVVTHYLPAEAKCCGETVYKACI